MHQRRRRPDLEQYLVPDRTDTYAAALLIDWYAGKTARAYTLTSSHDEWAGQALPLPVFRAESPDGTLAVAIAKLYEPESDPAAEDARAFMEERLSAGLVRGPHMLWAPPRAAVPADEPDASDFTQRVQPSSPSPCRWPRCETKAATRPSSAASADGGR
jgi:hypothetical protein